jgi:hypothetical protein
MPARKTTTLLLNHRTTAEQRPKKQGGRAGTASNYGLWPMGEGKEKDTVKLSKHKLMIISRRGHCHSKLHNVFFTQRRHLHWIEHFLLKTSPISFFSYVPPKLYEDPIYISPFNLVEFASALSP